jgi:acyl-CoA thioesterase
MGDFEIDTRLDGGNGRYRAEISRDWEIWGPNGGYVAAIALRAAGLEAEIQRPASFAAHFLAVAQFGAVDVEVTAIRRGRRAESLAVSMQQEGRGVLQAIVRTAAIGPGYEHDVGKAPEVRDPDELKDFQELLPDQPPIYPFWQNLEGRPVWPERFSEGIRPRAPLFEEWFRFRPRATFDDPFVDAGRLLLLVDTLAWPAASQPYPGREFIAPNLDVTAWFHRLEPESAWLLVQHECPIAEGGLMGTTARVWSRDRRLLASGGAQLLCVPAPPRE